MHARCPLSGHSVMVQLFVFTLAVQPETCVGSVVAPSWGLQPLDSGTASKAPQGHGWVRGLIRRRCAARAGSRTISSSLSVTTLLVVGIAH